MSDGVLLRLFALTKVIGLGVIVSIYSNYRVLGGCLLAVDGVLLMWIAGCALKRMRSNEQE